METARLTDSEMDWYSHTLPIHFVTKAFPPWDFEMTEQIVPFIRRSDFSLGILAIDMRRLFFTQGCRNCSHCNFGVLEPSETPHPREASRPGAKARARVLSFEVV